MLERADQAHTVLVYQHRELNLLYGRCGTVAMRVRAYRLLTCDGYDLVNRIGSGEGPFIAVPVDPLLGFGVARDFDLGTLP